MSGDIYSYTDVCGDTVSVVHGAGGEKVLGIVGEFVDAAILLPIEEIEKLIEALKVEGDI